MGASSNPLDSNSESDTIIGGRSSPDSTGHLFILLFFFQSSFFLWIKLGLFLLFPSAFILFSLITHICFSLLENDLRRTVAPKNVRMSELPGHFVLFCKLQKGGKAYAKRSQRGIQNPFQMDSS